MKKLLCFILSLMLLAVLHTPGNAYQERLILSRNDGNCSLRVEANDEERVIRLPVQPGHPECHAKKETVQRLLKAAFAKTDPPKLKGRYGALFLGRINDYPWLSEYLAVTAHADSRWDRKKGKPVSMDLYQYVRSILLSKEVTAQFEETFGNSGYRITSVTVEKICVGRSGDLPLYRGKPLPGKIPCDAVVWFRLERNPSNRIR